MCCTFSVEAWRQRYDWPSTQLQEFLNSSSFSSRLLLDFRSIMDAHGSAQAFLPKTRFDVWGHFTRKKDTARCNLCGKEYKYSSSTSKLQKHLRTCAHWRVKGSWKCEDNHKPDHAVGGHEGELTLHGCSSARRRSLSWAFSFTFVDWLTTSGGLLSIVYVQPRLPRSTHLSRSWAGLDQGAFVNACCIACEKATPRWQGLRRLAASSAQRGTHACGCTMMYWSSGNWWGVDSESIILVKTNESGIDSRLEPF